VSAGQDVSEVARARSDFFHGRRDILVVTERFHYYQRFKIRGIQVFLCFFFYFSTESSLSSPSACTVIDASKFAAFGYFVCYFFLSEHPGILVVTDRLRYYQRFYVFMLPKWLCII